ncbi:MAG: hypothetical protein ABIP11_08620 [Luteimonas sp.]
MKKHSLKLFVCGMVLASATGACLAAADTAAADNTPQSVGDILQFQHALRDKLESPTGEYSKFDQSSIRKMEAAQDQVFHTLAGVTSLDQLNEGQKIELSNSLDSIKATLLANQGERKICHIEKKIGSNMSERRCETVSDREARIHDADQFLNHGRTMTPPHSGG